VPRNAISGPSAPLPAPEPAARSGGNSLLWILLVAILAIAGAFGFRYWLQREKVKEAAHAAQVALARDTYGGFRDCDLALRELVHPGSKEISLVLMRAYALAELAGRYGDDQAAIESKLLMEPIELQIDRGDLALQSDDLSRLYASEALLALGEKAPGDAIVALGKVADQQSSGELLVVRAEADAIDERPDLAKAALDLALKKDPELLEGLRLAAEVAYAAHRPVDAAGFYRRILIKNPAHVPSLVARAELAVEGTGVPADVAADSLNRVLSLLPSEGSPDEQCRALVALVRLDLRLGHSLTAPSHLDRAGDLEDAPPSCQIDLASLDRRLGRNAEALALLTRAAKADDPGEAPLALGEVTDDAHLALELSKTAAAPDMRMTQNNIWDARAAAIGVRANLMLGQRKAALALQDALQVETPAAWVGMARLRSVENGKAAKVAEARALENALKLARQAKQPGDALADVGEAALSLQSYGIAQVACDAAAAVAAGNCRAFVCAARALHALGKNAEARSRLDQALLINPDVKGLEKLKTDLMPEATALVPAQ
jgi:tetratricopeptide (TPR) repeat protein